MMENRKLLHEIAYPVIKEDIYANMTRYEKMEAFLENCQSGKPGKIVLYEIRNEGELTRKEFVFDGVKMTVSNCIGAWNEEGKAVVASNTEHEIKQWSYTKKGWFIYEVKVPEFPKVSEVIPSHVMVKVKPWEKEYRRICEKYLLPIGYYGTNMFTIDWTEGEEDKIIKNDAPSTPFQTSIPEIVEMKKKDGIYVLTMDAVCEMLGEEQAMRHQLTIRIGENGEAEYLGNKVLKPYE